VDLQGGAPPSLKQLSVPVAHWPKRVPLPVDTERHGFGNPQRNVIPLAIAPAGFADPKHSLFILKDAPDSGFIQFPDFR